ncbi:MAG: hypothetical protein GX802_01490 [Clostridiales bacterium]|jgi:ethanolamine utilization cobalamin adenosyltransferase|nr:hypothetical protein [Clostridiales bacterium]
MRDSTFTELYRNEFVRKDDPKIEFRGRLDSTIASAAYCSSLFLAEKNIEFSEYVAQVTKALMEVMRADIVGGVPRIANIMGEDMDKLHEMSHNPQKYFKKGHFVPAPDSGVALAYLNVLRTHVRECERAYIRVNADLEAMSEVFVSISLALNRISSAVYVLMCKYASENGI